MNELTNAPVIGYTISLKGGGTVSYDSLKRAQQKYDQEKTTVFKMRLNIENDMDIIRHLETVDNKSGYVKRLIRQDMIRSGN